MSDDPKPAPTASKNIAVVQLTAQQESNLRKRANQVDLADYFQILGLQTTATESDIKRAFHRESRTFHPDRFYHLPPSQAKTDIEYIYKRIIESYYVLRDEAKRKKYLADISGPERTQKLRYTEATESELKAEVRKAAEDEYGTHPKARPFFRAAVADIAKADWAAAERNLKMGLTYESQNERFKEKLSQVRQQLEEQRRAQPPSLLIK